MSSIIFSDYETDRYYQEPLQCNNSSLNGRLISIIDIPSQLIKGAVGGTLGLVASVIKVVIGIFALLSLIWNRFLIVLNRCTRNDEDQIENLEVRCDVLTKHYREKISSGLLGATLGTAWTVFTRIAAAAGDVFGFVVPQVGRKARTFIKVFNTAIRLENDSNKLLSRWQCTPIQGADFKHTIRPQSVEVGDYLYGVVRSVSKMGFNKISEKICTSIKNIYENYKDKTGISTIDNVYGDDALFTQLLTK